MNNTSIGNKTERSISSILRDKGYWSYRCPKSSTGSQPVDIIAIKGGSHYKVWLIDGKHVRGNEPSFVLGRIEPNQWASLKYVSDFAHFDIENLGFVIEFERIGKFYWLSYKSALELVKNDIKSIKFSQLRLFEEVLDENDNK